MDDRVVVGYDASRDAAAAVRWAAAEAARHGWALEVVHAGPVGAGGVPGAPQDPAVAGVALARAAVPGLAAAGAVVGGEPAAGVLGRSADARLLVVGRHGAGGSWAPCGSVTAGVLRASPCPVLVVPHDAPPPGTAPVVIGFDGSVGAFGALEAGCAAALLRGAEVAVVVAGEPRGAPPRRGSGGPRPLPGDEAGRIRDRVLAWAAAHADVPVHCDVVACRPQDALVRRSRGAGLVVVATRGRGGARSLAPGSVSRAVVERAHCPVLVTRTAGRGTPGRGTPGRGTPGGGAPRERVRSG